MERIPPHNEEAERSALGAVMLNKEVLLDVTEEVKPEDFYNESHREIFDAIMNLYRENTAVDMLTVCEELNRRKNSGYGRRKGIYSYADCRSTFYCQCRRIRQDRF